MKRRTPRSLPTYTFDERSQVSLKKLKEQGAVLPPSLSVPPSHQIPSPPTSPLPSASLSTPLSSSVLSSRAATCTHCTAGPLCISGEPKVIHQHTSCPLSHWTSPQKTLWLLGDLAQGGITQFLKALIPHLPGEHYISLASSFKRDNTAWPHVPATSTPTSISSSHPSSTYSSASHPTSTSPVSSPLPFPPVFFSSPSSSSSFTSTHIVSRHPEHTPLSPLELSAISGKVIVHCHGPSAWSQQCIDYAASVLSPSPTLSAHSLPSSTLSAHSPLLICNSNYTLSNITVPPTFAPTIIPLPITITRSPYTRSEDRAYLSSLCSPTPLLRLASPPSSSSTSTLPISRVPDPTLPWWIYCGRLSPEKNIPHLLSLHSKVPSELFIVSDGNVPGVWNIPWQFDLSRIYNATDVCICTSTSEGGPIFAIEALLHGNTVYSTPVGHMPDVLPPSYILRDNVPDSLFRPCSLERTTEQISLAWSAAQYFARSIPEWKRANKMT